MSALHAYFAQRNQHAFQRTLEAGRSQSNGSNGPSTNGGKSWTRPSGLSMGMASLQPDINARDWLGRTVLHLACASTDSAAVEYVRMILSHPGVNTNLQDRESMWTALHRALYHGNLAIAILLLQRTDTDPSLKDLEGYTPFDLYNSTVEHTKPSDSPCGRTHLFTWGTNRNATLCLGDDKDRVYPDQVQLRLSEYSQEPPTLAARLLPLPIRDIAMSKLHTVVLTGEHRHNVRVCGFGSGGRLGVVQHTQYSLTTVPGYGGETAVATALGQDHTLILSKTGEVYSWGLNRFSQLGYLVEISTTGAGKPEEPVQTTPKKVPTPKNVVVRGIAVSKIASACWSAEHLYTWGTNNGQLGYDKAAQPIQISPRVVTKVQKPVIMVAMAENAMACLLETREVLCFANDRQTKINFPVETFPSEITPYRPPQTVAITKITVSEGIFAALSTKGEVFTFSIPTFAGATPTGIVTETAVKPVVIRPQRVWSLRKKFSAATDLALGTDGALAVCTESGHVYVAARGLKGTFSASAKGSKFVRMPGLQRVIKISANATGGFGALHAAYRPSPIDLEGNTIPEDFATMRPWLKQPDDHGLGKAHAAEPITKVDTAAHTDEDDEEEGEDEIVLNDIRIVTQLSNVLRRDKQCRSENPGRGLFTNTRLGYGADVMIQVGSTFEFPAHRLLLAMRSPILRDVFSGGRLKKDSDSKINLTYRTGAKAGIPQLTIDGCRPMAALLLMTYLYTDDIPAVWDRRVLLAVEFDLVALGVRTADVKRDLRYLARILELPRLDEALEPLVKRKPVASLLRDVKVLHANTGSVSAKTMPQPDVTIKLADRNIQAYSLVLRARSPLFAAFFDTEDWTRQRWSKDGTIQVDFSHLKSRTMDFVMRFICRGEEEFMFEQLDFIQSVDELIDFLFDVVAVASELHLSRLILVCSRVMVQYISNHNIGYMLSDATYFHTLPLVNRLQAYMAIHMETLLEGRLLDNLSAEVVKQLSIYVRSCQAIKSPVARSSKIIDNAMLWWGDWLALQDIPEPIIPSAKGFALRDNPRISPPVPMTKRSSMEHVQSKRPSLPASTVSGLGVEDDVFTMDDSAMGSSTPKATLAELPTTPPKKAIGTWKVGPSTPKADLKSIMAEAKVPRESLPSVSSPRAIPPRQLSQTNWRAGPSTGDIPIRVTGAVQRVDLGSSPWKAAEIAIAPVNSNSGTPGSPSPVPRTRAEAYPALGSAQTRPLGSPAKAVTPGMGPTIAPTRQVSSSRVEGKRSTSTSGKVWSSPTPRATVESIPSASGLSFADIQAIQLAQAQPAEQDKRSLVEIQEEERARQEENDFLRWWAEEEARTKAEMVADTPAANNAESKKRRSRKPKDHRDVPASTSDTTSGSRNPPTKGGDRPPQSRKSSRVDQPTNGAASGSQSTKHSADAKDSGPSRRGGPRHRGGPQNGHGPRAVPQAQAI